MGSEGRRGQLEIPTMALHIWGKEGTMGNPDHGTAYTRHASATGAATRCDVWGIRGKGFGFGVWGLGFSSLGF